MACACECGDEPSGSIKCGEPVSFSRRTLLHGVCKYGVSNIFASGQSWPIVGV